MSRKTYRKIITSSELTEQINPKNKKMTGRFLKEKNTRCSDTTIVNYDSDLNIFFTWNLLHNENKFFIDVKKIEFADFFGYCVKELQWGSARFGRMKSCLSTLSEFICRYFDEDYPSFKNIILKAIESMPKNPAREKTILSEEQVNSLLDYLKNEINKPQEACLVALAIGSGARVSELTRFTVDNIDKNNVVFDDMFLETTEKIKTKGRGKLGKQIEKFIIRDIFLPYYEEWLIKRSKIMSKKNKEHNAIFIKSNGDPATTATIRGWVRKWEDFLQVPFYPHCLRHYITTYLSKLGLESDFIVEIMGWSSPEMYKLYNDSSAKERKWKDLDNLKEHLNKNS